MTAEPAGGTTPPAGSPFGTLRLMALGLAFVAACGSNGAVDTTTAATSSTAIAPIAPLTAAPDTVTDLEVQGHRGARGLQPENTLPAFETALDLGVDTLELDLHFTSDGQLVVWHDPIVPPDKCRLDPDQSIAGPDLNEADDASILIAGFTRDELRAYSCDKNPDQNRLPDQQATATGLAGDSYQIVTLGELFDFVARYAEAEGKTPEQRAGAAAVMFNVETKRVEGSPETINDGFDGVNPGPFELTLLQLIADRGLEDRVVVQSFDHRSLRAIRSVDSSIRLAALTSRNVPFSADFAAFADIWSPDYRAVSSTSLAAAHQAGLEVIPWTVNDLADMSRLIELGVDGLITDRPDTLLALIGALP